MRTSATCLAGGCLLLSAAASSAVPPAVDELSFDVLLDGERIGSHTFRISDGGRRVQTEAAFDVKILYVPVYSYRHSNTEVWRSGCLQQIRSRTDSNGEQYEVQGQDLDEGFRVTTRSDTQTYPRDCVMSFAYWDPQVLTQRRLLNAQTGELLEVDIESLGTSALVVDGRRVAVDGYRITARAENLGIKVFYRRADGRWLSLETVLENGRVMRYLPGASERMADAGDGVMVPLDERQ